MPDITDTDEKMLSEIIGYFNREQISVFIGAGFSKNASEKFPDWNQLFSGMVDELYEEELDNLSKKEKEMKRKRIVQREGTLRIPQQFEEFKGRREDLTEYIKSRIKGIDPVTEDNLTVHKELLKLPWNDVYTTNYDTLLEQSTQLISRGWTCVKDSTGLKEYPKNRIIKLHGSLRTTEDYGFDGCLRHQYIITEKDYEEYPGEHYGFTTFMQAKMLQEATCMIGFSGNDPNFRYWIHWVRDLLKARDTSEDPLPIFLLDISVGDDIDRSPATEQFYRNHFIKRIALAELYPRLWGKNHPHSGLTGEIKEKELTPKVLLLEFFKYLGKEVVFPHHNTNIEGVDRSENNKLWEALQSLRDNDLFLFIERNRSKILSKRIPVPHTLGRAFSLIDKLNSHYNKPSNEWDPSYDIWYLLELLIIISKNYLLNPNYIVGDERFDDIENCFLKITEEEFLNDENKLSIWIEYGILLLKTYRQEGITDQFEAKRAIIEKNLNKCTLEIDLNKFSHEIQYQRGLFYANTFQQEKLNRFIEGWRPEDDGEGGGQWLLKKAFLLNLFHNSSSMSREDAITERISQLLDRASANEENPQERLYILENYALVLWGQEEGEEKRINAKIESLKNSGYSTLDSLISYLVKENVVEQEIKPADKIRDMGRTVSFGGIPEDERPFFRAMQFFKLVEEGGVFLFHCSVFWKNITENCLYDQITSIQNNYPLYALSYSFVRFGHDASENFARRIVQEMVFSKELTDEKRIGLLNALLKGLIRAFDYRRKSGRSIREYLFLIAELMRSVNYTAWATFWESLWDGITSSDPDSEWEDAKSCFYRGRAWGWREPIRQIMMLIDDPSIVKKIIQFYFTDPELEIDTLLTIRHNPHFNNALAELCENPDFTTRIFDLINFEPDEVTRLKDIFALSPTEAGKELLGYLEEKGTVSQYDKVLIDGLEVGNQSSINYLEKSLLPGNSDRERVNRIFPWLSKSIQTEILAQIDRDNLSSYEISFLVDYLVYIDPQDKVFSYCMDLFNKYIRTLPGSSHPPEFPVYKFSSALLTRKKSRPQSYIWDIYSSYEDVWPKIKEYTESKQVSLRDYIILKTNIYPYFEIFNQNADTLSSSPNFHEIFSEIKEVHYNLMEIETRSNKIIWGDIDDFVSVSNSIINEQINYPSIALQNPIALILERLIYQDYVKHEAVLRNLFTLFYYFKEESDFLSLFTDKILSLLEKFKTPIEGHDRLFLEECCIHFATYFKGQSNSSVLQHWLAVKKESPYYEVRNLTHMLFKPPVSIEGDT